MPVQWENKEIAMANILTLVGKPLLFFFVLIEVPKGQLISKTIYVVLDSPKKRTKNI